MKRRILVTLLGLIFATNCGLQPTKFEANIPKEDTVSTDFASKNPKNPIVIELNQEGRLFIKGKDYGSIKDMTLLEKEVSRMLEINKKEPVENASAVFIKSPRSAKYGDIKLLIDKLKSLGAAPIGLNVDD